ncbi:MAG TPA: response regulator transcription factor [Chitinophagaceae bacterium]|jgi:two-component system invasion response regulator UvrY|nr:response regulator transcription factor [Chitinophagaceae bacterium]
MKMFLLVDDHFVVRAGIKGVLAGLYPSGEVHEAADAEAATGLLKQHRYDLVMMDIQVPNNNMLGLMEYIHTRYPDTKVLMFSMSSESIYARRFLKAGAMGFLAKDSPPAEIAKAVSLVLANRKYISETLAELLAEDSIKGTPSNPFQKLSIREFEIVSFLLTGQGISEIAGSLHLQVSTVGTHKARAFEKLGVENLLQLKELAVSYGV